MGKIVERKTKKKKGRPSLLDLQKRSLKEQQYNQHQQLQQQKKRTPNPNLKITPSTLNPHSRSTRRNPNPDAVSLESDNNDDAGDEDDELIGKRREKKLKLVLKLPSQRSSLNSTSRNSDSYNSETNADDEIAPANYKKRKIVAIGDGSGQGYNEKEEQHVSASKDTKTLHGTQLEMGPSTPLPDKKLLLFILDRLQKKDTYAVFAEPVDPNELPDYHEVIDHPMDFGTVRKKLVNGAYANLEQFERDVFLICSNAMQYNAPDTVYFRQARSIQELAKKNFENLRNNSDDNEPESKIVRRGRPPTKNLKKQTLGPLEHPRSDFRPDASLATGLENTACFNYDLKKGRLLDKSGSADFPGRSLHGSHNTESYSGRFAEHKFERNDELTGSILKGNWMKNGKKQVVFDENRRNTYKQSPFSSGGQEPSVLTTFDGHRKQLMTVGLHSEYGYARSLARFAANLGPVTWKIASKKIEKSLPAGINFGPGWVGENEGAPPRPLVLAALSSVQPSPSQPCAFPGNSYEPSTLEMRGLKSSGDPEREIMSEKHMASSRSDLGSHSTKPLLSSASTSSSPIVTNRTPESVSGRSAAVGGLNSCSSPTLLSGSGVSRPGPPFQMLQNPMFRHGFNGSNGAYGLNLRAQMGKVVGSVDPCLINFHSSHVNETVSRANSSIVYPTTANGLNSEDTKLENTGRSNEGVAKPKMRHHQSQASWQEVSRQQKPDSVPPDLNIRFQTPGSPNSNSNKADLVQPDLALQL